MLGVLHVGSVTPRTFTADEVVLLQLAGIGSRPRSRTRCSSGASATRGCGCEQIQAITDTALAQLGLEELLDRC